MTGVDHGQVWTSKRGTWFVVCVIEDGYAHVENLYGPYRHRKIRLDLLSKRYQLRRAEEVGD